MLLELDSMEGKGKEKKEGGGEKKTRLFLPINICPNDRQTNQSSEG